MVTCRQAAGQSAVTLTRRERCEDKEERERQRGEVRAFLCCHATLTTTRLAQLLRLRMAPVVYRHFCLSVFQSQARSDH